MPYLDWNKHWREQEELANAPTLGNLHPDARAQAIARAAMVDRMALEEKLTKDRLAWLHSTAATDADGYEYGIFRVKWQDGRAVDIQRTRTDGSDLPALTGAQPAPAAPSGYKLVPLEPTPDMVTRAENVVNDPIMQVYRDEIADVYRAMLSAAPAAQPADSAMEVLRELVDNNDNAPDNRDTAAVNAWLPRWHAAWRRARTLSAASNKESQHG